MKTTLNSKLPNLKRSIRKCLHLTSNNCTANHINGPIVQKKPSLCLYIIRELVNHKKQNIDTTEADGIAVRSVLLSGLECGDLRFESCNDKRLGLNPITPTLDPLVPS